MMGALGYVTGSIIVPELVSYLISKSLTTREEQNIIEEIQTIITDFNRSFDDQEVDSNYFIEFLKKERNMCTIFDSVFNSFESSVSINHDDLSNQLAIEAIEYVNSRKILNGHPEVKNKKVFEDYFKALFSTLIDIRTSLLGIGGKALASTIDDSIKESENNITKFISKSMTSNILVDDKVTHIEELIDRGLYSDAEEEIEYIFDTVNNISLEQRIKLLYQRVRIYIHTDDYGKIPAIKNKIQKLDPISKYCYEVDYWLACKNNDSTGVNKAIHALKDLGTEEFKLMLKEVYFSVIRNDYETALSILLNEKGELKETFKDDANAYFYLGIILLNKDKIKEAAEAFGKAKKLKYSILYDYNEVTSKTISFLLEIQDLHDLNDEIKIRAKQLIEDNERVHYFIKGLDANIRLHHWHNYLSLLNLISLEDVLLKYGEIEDDLISSEPIIALMSESHFLLKHYKEAIPYLERVWNINPIFLMRLCECYKKEDMWSKIEIVLKMAEERNFDNDGRIFFYGIEFDLQQGALTEAIHKILTQGEKYYSRPWFIERVIRFSIDNSQSELLEKFIDLIYEYKDAFLLRDRINLSHTLLKTNYLSLVRELLKNDYKASDEGIGLYLNSYGEADTTNPLFPELKQIVLDLYSSGIKNEYVLNRKFYLEFTTEKYLDAYTTIQEYGEKIGKNVFYHLNILQSVIFGSIEPDVSSSANYLLETSVLRYHIMAAQYFSFVGNWEISKITLLKAFYKLSEQISEEEVSGFVRVYFKSIHHHSYEVDFQNVKDNTVITLKNVDGTEIKYCLHSDESLVLNDGEEKFGCRNYKNSSDIGLVLKALGRVGEDIQIFGENYKVVEVLDINTYLFRYFLNKLLIEYPNNKFIFGVYAESTEASIEKIKEVVLAGKENIETKLSFYNFGVETGTPISYISGKDSERYLDTIQFLMNDLNVNFYTTYSGELITGRKYVLTISSLVVINALGYLDRLSQIKNRIYIADSVKPFVRKGIKDAIINAQLVTSTAFIDDDSNFRMYERTDEAKKFRNLFWTQIFIALGSFNELKPKWTDNELYDIMYDIVEISDFDSIYLTTNIDGVLITDDLFMSKINNSLGIPNTALNTIAFLYSEGLIDIDELIEVTHKLSTKKVINCINHHMLFDIYNHLINQNGTEAFEKMYSIALEIFKNLFSQEVMIYHTELFQRFRDLVFEKNRMTPMLYKLVEQPFGFKPYEELIEDVLSDFKIEFILED